MIHFVHFGERLVLARVEDGSVLEQRLRDWERRRRPPDLDTSRWGSDELIPDLAERGPSAIEAYHSDHDSVATAHYLAVAAKLGLAVTGGSDYHGDVGHRCDGLGVVTLPKEYTGC